MMEKKSTLAFLGVVVLLAAVVSIYLFYRAYDAEANKYIVAPEREVSIYKQEALDAHYEKAMLEYEQAKERRDSQSRIWLVLLIVVGGGLIATSCVLITAAMLTKREAYEVEGGDEDAGVQL